MAHAYQLSEDALDDLSEQISHHLGHLYDTRPRQAESVDLCETFEVWMLGAHRLAAGAKAGSDLMQLAKSTKHLHHQIKQDGKPLCSAASSEEEAGSPQLSKMSLSPLVEKIDRAIDWLDHHSKLQDDPLVRLLVVPAYHVKAFWLVGEARSESRVVIIDAPAQFQNLPLLKILSSREFIAA